ncbi:MAG: dual specificity protein phosphatase [Pirellulales bacterium]
MREVVPNLVWIGNAGDLRDVKSVLARGIEAVVDLAAEEPAVQYPRDAVYCRIPLVDSTGNAPSMLRLAIETTSRLIQSRVPALVACGGGMSRSPAIVAAALARVEGVTLEEALGRIAAVGPHDPSPGLLADIQGLFS